MAAVSKTSHRGDGTTLLTVERTLEVLELFRATRELGVRDIARRLGISPTVVHRIAVTLTGLGYLVQTESRSYRLGPKIRELADSVALTDTDVRRLALPFLRLLQEDSGETVVLSRIHDGHTLAVLAIESAQALRVVAPLEPCPVRGSSAVGQVVLAFSGGSRDQADSAVEGSPASGEADETVRPDLELVRERGWAVDSHASLPGAMSLAAPVFAPGGLLVLGVFGPEERLAGRAIEHTAAVLVRVAAELKQGLLVLESPADLNMTSAASAGTAVLR